MNGQLPGVLMSLLDIQNAAFTDAAAYKPDRTLAARKPVALRGAGAYTPPQKLAQARGPRATRRASRRRASPRRSCPVLILSRRRRSRGF